MTAVASVSSPWIPEDDLLLKNSIEAGASLEALAKGAVKFSRRFTLRELRDRWYSLLYDPDVSAQASARMAELELSGSNPSLKSKLDNLKGSDKVPEKRKFGSIRKHYYAMRKRIKNEYFSSPGFFEERNLHNYSQQENNVITNHEGHGGDAIDACLANNLGFEEKDFEILRQAFPESIGTIATTTTTTIGVDNNFINGSTREDGLYKFTQNASPSRNELIASFDPNNEIKNATCIEDSGPSETPHNENLPKSDKLALFGGKQIFSSPVSDGSASFHTMGFSSPSTRLPLWKTLEDISAPAMPVDENNAESHQVAEETLALPEDCNHLRESKTSPRYDGSHQVDKPNGFINSSGVQDGEYTDLPDSLLNFSNEDDMLFMEDVDTKDTVHESPKDVQEVLEIPTIQCPDESNDPLFHNDQHDVPSTSISEPESLQLTEGTIICTLNREDPDIPCNDDIFLLIHPSTTFAPSVGLQINTDAIGPLSSSSHEKDGEQETISVRKGKDHAPCFARSNTGGPNASLVGPSFKHELPDGEYLGPLPGKPHNLRIPRPMHKPLEIAGNGMLEEVASKVELPGSGGSTMYSEMPLPLEVGSVKMIDPESVEESYVDDQNNSDSDGDIPYFSDVEAMILEMDLAHTQESCITSEVARYQNEGAKRMIMRLEHAARSSFQRAMSSQRAFAIFYGRRLKHYIKKTEVTIGRSTDDTVVDIDLRKEGRANKISRRQAIIKMETDGSFSLKNLGASSITINGKEVAHGQLVTLGSSCLIEIRGMSFVFEINDKYVRRFLDNQPRV